MSLSPARLPGQLPNLSCLGSPYGSKPREVEIKRSHGVPSNPIHWSTAIERIRGMRCQEGGRLISGYDFTALSNQGGSCLRLALTCDNDAEVIKLIQKVLHASNIERIVLVIPKLASSFKGPPRLEDNFTAGHLPRRPYSVLPTKE